MTTRRLLAFGHLALAVAMFVSCLSAQTTLEPMDGRYRKVRGMDFIMTFQNPATMLGVPSYTPTSDTPPVPTYRDIASGAAMWMCYDSSTASFVDDQLSRVREAGFNTVRVWLSWHYYQHGPAGQMATRFRDFLLRCEFYGLYVIPVVWDADHFEPDNTSLRGQFDCNFQKWIRSPGEAVINAQSGHLGSQHRQFIVDMINAAHDPLVNPQVVLMWDAMNEPLVSSSNFNAVWIAETLGQIKTTDPNAKTAVTPPYWNATNSDQLALVTDELDVMAFNFYGYGQRDVEGLCNNVKILCAQAGLGETKPILAMEAGLVGRGQYYPEVMNLLWKVPAQYTGNPNVTDDGIGFCLFSANVGQKWFTPFDPNTKMLANVNFPIVEEGDGLFYAPNYDVQSQPRFVRDYYPSGGNLVMGTLSLISAIRQSHQLPAPLQNFQQMPFLIGGNTNPNYIPQFPTRLQDGVARSKILGILDEAKNDGVNCARVLGDLDKLKVELDLASWIYGHSFAPDADYYQFPTQLVTPPDMIQMKNDYIAVYGIAITDPAWATNQTLRTNYMRLFDRVSTYWQLGGYDIWYQ